MKTLVDSAMDTVEQHNKDVKLDRSFTILSKKKFVKAEGVDGPGVQILRSGMYVFLLDIYIVPHAVLFLVLVCNCEFVASSRLIPT